MTDSLRQPQGEMVLRTLAMPADTNANGDIFGGWLMSQMDMGERFWQKKSPMAVLLLCVSTV